MGLPSSPALLTSDQAPSIGGAWSLAIVTSAARIAERQNRLLRRLMMTGLAAALAVVAVGIFILRQQRQAATLKERLYSAQELATLREKSDAIIENEPIGILDPFFTTKKRGEGTGLGLTVAASIVATTAAR